MRATERYERAWNAFQIHLNHNPKASLIPLLKESNWLLDYDSNESGRHSMPSHNVLLLS